MTNNLSSGAGSNVSNLKILNAAILGFADRYNPANKQITATALQAVYLLGLSAVNNVDSIQPSNINAKNIRSMAFLVLEKLTTRISNAFKSLVTDKTAREHVRSMSLLIQKGRVNPKKAKTAEMNAAENPIPVKEITSHKSSYDKQLENFYKLIQYLASFPAYKPNEADLTVGGLSAFYSELTVMNQAVIDTQAQLDKSRIARQTVLYQPVTGLVQLGNDSKSYIKSVFGPGSPEYKQISKLKFRIYKK